MVIENCGCGCGDCGLGAIDWGSIIQTGVNTASGILSNRYGVPPQGSAVYRGADGSYQFVRTGGQLPTGAVGTFGAPILDTGTIVTFGALLIGGIFLLKAIK